MEEQPHMHSLQQEQPLVKGVFTPAEAAEIIRSLFSSKIQFHSVAAFGITERTGKTAEEHTGRAKELAQSLQQLLQYIEEQARLGRSIVIDCMVKMQPSEKTKH